MISHEKFLGEIFTVNPNIIEPIPNSALIVNLLSIDLKLILLFSALVDIQIHS